MDKTDPTPLPPAPTKRSFFYQDAQKPIWSLRWFHWALGTAVVLMICSFVLPTSVRVLALAEPILVPILVGLVLAYIFNPPVSFAERKLRVRRPITAASIIMLGMLGLAMVAIFVVPAVASQATEMVKEIPGKLDALAAKIGRGDFKLRDTKEIELWLTDMATRVRTGEFSITPYLGQAGKALGAGWILVAGMLGIGAYLILFGIVSGACFFFFSWHFSAITAWPQPFLPVEYRAEILRIAGLCDRAVSAFIRGRLIQAVIFGSILTVGWGLTGVNYYFLLGVFGGLLMLLPYLSIITLPLVIGIVWFAHLGTNDKGAPNVPLEWYMLAGPLGVYLFAYLTDAFAVEPFIQGKATGLSPLAVLLAVLLGGALAGILGIILAIPTAACLMIIWREAALPRLKELASGTDTK